VPVASAGTHPAADGVHPDALRVADQHGLSVAGTQTWHVDEVVTPDDLVVAVCDQVHEELPRQSRLHWSVPDPVRRGSLSAFESALDEISQRVEQLAGALSTPPSPN
jgi:protein-tyrosine-phosphatase